MDIAIALAFLLGAALLVQWLVRLFGGEEHDPVKIWDAICILIVGKLAIRGLTWWFPNLDMPVRMSLSFGVYVAAITIFLWCYEIRPLRGVLIAILIAFLMTVRSVLYVIGLI